MARLPSRSAVSMPQAIQRAGLTLSDMDVLECNEAFAVQALAVMRELGMDPAITNVNGCAVALGHPLGCSGARILTTLLHEMKRRAPDQARPYYGLATLCNGGGGASASTSRWTCSAMASG